MRDLRSWVRHNLVWCAGLLVVIIGGLAYVQTIVEIRQATACQARFNAAFASALGERAAASQAERDTANVSRAAQRDVNRAQRNLIIAVIGNTELDPEVQQEAYRVFLAEIDRADRAIAEAIQARADADRTRQQHPIPANRC